MSQQDDIEYQLDTLAIRTGHIRSFEGEHSEPIFLTSSFVYENAAEAAAKSAMEMNMRTVAVTVKGPGSGRESAIRALAAAGLEVTSIKDVTPVPHNGSRPPKRRRV